MQWCAALEAFEAYMVAAAMRPATVKVRLYYLRRAVEVLPDPEQVRGEQLVSWLAGHSGWAPETRKSARAALASFFGWAHGQGLLPTDPAAKLPPVRIPRAAPRPAPEVALARALMVASERDALMVRLAAYAGLRRSEIAGLRWCDIGDEDLRVHGKGGRVRMVPMIPGLVATLERERMLRSHGRMGTGWRYVVDPASPYLFPAAGGHLRPDSVGRTLARLLGPGLSGHTLRHRFATRAYAGTRDLRAVQELLGHSSPDTTARYVQVIAEQLRAAVEAAA